MTYDRDDKGRFNKGDFVINKDPFHRYYNQKGVIATLTGLIERHEDHSMFPKLKKGLYRFQEFKVQYHNRESTILTTSEWFVEY
tara:strand:+ start:1530 stop:1781 length:252 start_codon:yes stop_codon:yes gene_type:complete